MKKLAFHFQYSLLLPLFAAFFVGCAPDAPSSNAAASNAAASVSSAPVTPQSSLEEPDDDLLVDFRRSLNFDPPKLPARDRLQVLRAVYGPTAPIGNITINSMRDGSFTRPNAQETLYVMQAGGPAAANPASLAEVTFAVFSQGRLVAKFQTEEGNFIVRLSDIDLNGVNEILTSRSAFTMGTLSMSVSLMDITDKKLTTLKDFGRVYENSCEGAAGAGGILAAALRARVENGTLNFTVKGFRGDCSAAKDPSAFHEAPEEKLGEGAQ